MAHSITAQVQDDFGNPVPGKRVEITYDQEDGSTPQPQSDAGTTDTGGELDSMVCSNNFGEVDITAATMDLDGDTITATATKFYGDSETDESDCPDQGGGSPAGVGAVLGVGALAFWAARRRFPRDDLPLGDRI
jgi:hypothetical protein